MKRGISIAAMVIASMFFFVSPGLSVDAPNLGEQISGQIKAGAQGGGLGEPVAKPQEAIASFIQIFLGLLATIFLILVVMSGFWLVTARGNDQKQEKAMDTLRRAVIGFIVIIIAYSISIFVGTIIKSAVNKEENGTYDCGFFQNWIRVGDNSRCE